MGVGAARFEEEDADGWIGGQSVCEHAARRTRPDDDVVIALAISHALPYRDRRSDDTAPAGRRAQFCV
jgi:hypothetical protein